MFEGRSARTIHTWMQIERHRTPSSGGDRPRVAYSIALFIPACQSYQPMPPSAEAIAQSMPSSMLNETGEAATFHHPLLRPVIIPSDGTLTPTAAAVIAVLRSPTLRALRTRRGVAEAQLLQAGILPNPQLSATMDFPIAGATDGTINAFGLGATWDVTSLIVHEQNGLAASHDRAAVILDIAWQEWQAALAAKLHATRVLWLSAQREELARQVQEAEDAERASLANARAGFVTLIESEAAGALVQKRRAALLASDATLISESSLLRQALGLPQDAQVRIGIDPQDSHASAPSPEEVSRCIETNRLDLAALRAGYASQEAKLHAAVLSQFPKIGLGITRARDTTDVGTIGFGVTLDLPIFDRGQGRIAAETATRQMLFDELVARTFEATSDAARAISELAAVGPQIAEARRTVDRLRGLAERLADARRLGDADVMQLAQARNDVADAQVELMHLEQQEAELRIAVEVATGSFMEGLQP
jgi:outer membrane protein TolC